MQTDDGKATDRDESQDQSADPPASDKATTRLGARYTVQEAAEILGTTIDGVRGRVRRGTLDSMKVEGVVYVLLDETSRARHADKTTSRPVEPSPDQPANPDQSELVEELRDQIGWLRREVERKDTIIMSLTQRIPELEAPASNPAENPVTEWLGDEESRREDEGMSTRPDEVRQSWHARTQEAPRAQRGGPEPASAGTVKGDVPAETQEPISSRQAGSWWRRFFGFE